MSFNLHTLFDHPGAIDWLLFLLDTIILDTWLHLDISHTITGENSPLYIAGG